MVAIQITTDTTGATLMLGKLGTAVKNWNVPLRAFGRILVRSITENFEAEGRPKPWKPLAMATLFSRLGVGRLVGKRGKALKRAQQRLANVMILQDSGVLKNSQRAEVSNNTLRVGPTGPAAIYGRIHQFGGKTGRGKKITIPARPFLVVQDEDLTELKDLVSDHIEKQIKG
jgi:phage virion morphogenesis protein